MQSIWKNGQLIPWHEAQTHVLTHSLHYGSAVFEGIRFYKTEQGPAVFKLREHIERFFYSAAQLAMSIPYSSEDICQAVVTTVKENGQEEGYIRPLAYYGQGGMKIVPDPNLPVEVIVACWPWGSYLSATAVDVACSPYIRIHPKSTISNAKISGHYINSLLAGLVIRNSHYHEALLLDDAGYVTEGTSANIFIIKNNRIITPPEGGILVGITRNTVMEIAQEFGLAVEEKYFKPEEVYAADEAFFTGTAVEITAIRSLDDRIIAQGKIGKITGKIQQRYQQIIQGQIPEHHIDLTWISEGVTA